MILAVRATLSPHDLVTDGLYAPSSKSKLYKSPFTELLPLLQAQSRSFWRCAAR